MEKELLGAFGLGWVSGVVSKIGWDWAWSDSDEEKRLGEEKREALKKDVIKTTASIVDKLEDQMDDPRIDKIEDQMEDLIEANQDMLTSIDILVNKISLDEKNDAKKKLKKDKSEAKAVKDS